MESPVGKNQHPLISIWTNPRSTIQSIIEDDPERMVILLASLGGILTALNRASTRNMGDKYPWLAIVAMAIVIGPFGGILRVYIHAALLRWTGSWIGGKADQEQLRAAVAWSFVPFVCTMAIWIPELILFREEMFVSNTPRIEASMSLAMTIFALSIVEIALFIWTIVLMAKCVGQVQGFSAWKGLGNMTLSGLVFVVPILVIVVLVMKFTNQI